MGIQENFDASREIGARSTCCEQQTRWIVIAKALLSLPYSALLVPLPYMFYHGVCCGNGRALLSLGLYVLFLGLFFRSRLVVCTMVGVFVGQLMADPVRWSLTHEIRSLILWPLLGAAVGLAADWWKPLES